ncbi:MAG: serine/threonine protein kinase [Candidatus Wallbacteria bacterium]|nr:serine/threonine protein kinase [Candidatus Wallbacteria bacterium]
MIEVGGSFKGYKILQFLGAGGSGAVYRAVQEGLDREVALKVVTVGGRSGSEERKRFQREARALARLAHPHIVRLYDFGEDGADLYYSMEYAEGRSLDQRLKAEGPLPRADAFRVMAQLLDALETVHSLGVLHRDIKPANVLLQPSGDILLGDFGLAREREATRVTRDGVLLGTLPYCPPEMVHAAETDARGDLYQAGVMFYELLSGRVPYCSEEILGMMKGTPLDPEKPFERAADVFDPMLAEFLRRAMDPAPGKRFACASGMRGALEGLLQARSGSGYRAAATRPMSESELPGGSPTRAAGPLELPRKPSRTRPQEHVSTLTSLTTLPENRVRLWLFVLSGICWLVLAVVLCRTFLWRIPQSAVGALPAPRPGDADTNRAPRLAPERLEAQKTLRARLLGETELIASLTRELPARRFTVEVALVAAAEIESASLSFERLEPAPALLEVNGRSSAGRLPVSLLLDGNNRFLLEGAGSRAGRSSGVLRVRRRSGASIALPRPAQLPELSPEASARVKRLIEDAKTAFQAGKYGDALKGCEQAAQVDPKSWEALWKKAVALHYITYVSRGLVAAGAGLEFLSPTDEDPESIRHREFECFNRSLELWPVEGNIWYDLGCGYRDFRRQSDAERSLALACLLSGRARKYWWELGRTLAEGVPRGRERGHPAMRLAVQAVTAAFVEDPQPGPGSAEPTPKTTDGPGKPPPISWLLDRSAIYRRAGELPRARADLQTVLAREPGNRAAQAALASLLPR